MIHLDHQRLPRTHRLDPADSATLVAVRRPRRLWPRRIEWQAAIVTLVVAILTAWTVAHVPDPVAEAGPLVVHTADGCGAVREGQ